MNTVVTSKEQILQTSRELIPSCDTILILRKLTAENSR